MIGGHGRRWAALRLATATVFLFLATAHAQTPGFQMERPDEDWRAYSDPQARKIVLGHLKHVAINDRAFVSLGGDYRLRYEVNERPQLGLTGLASDGYALQRLLLHADLHLDGIARLFFQLGHHRPFGKKSVTANDENGADIQQAFIEPYRAIGAGRLALRVGRQELSFGSPRYVTVRDGPNIRQSFDALRLFYEDRNWRVNAFIARPVAIRPGDFDDRRDRAQRFDGARFERTFRGPDRVMRLDGFIYRHDRRAARLFGQAGHDERTSFGAQISGTIGSIDFDSEWMLQRGSFGLLDIRASGLSVEAGYRFREQRWQPRLGLRAFTGSGDRNARDRKAETFIPPFPRGAWFSDASYATYSNTRVVSAMLSASPAPALALDFKADFLWRRSTADSVYAFPLVPLPGTQGAFGGRFAGTAPSLGFSWRPDPQVTVAGQLVHHRPARWLRKAGARAATFFMTSTALRF